MINNKLLAAKKENPIDEEKPKKNKNILGFRKEKIKNNYGKYSGVIDEEGKAIDNPTYDQSVKTMVSYLKKNTPESNVYRAEHAHRAVNYNRKTLKPSV